MYAVCAAAQAVVARSNVLKQQRYCMPAQHVCVRLNAMEEPGGEHLAGVVETSQLTMQSAGAAWSTGQFMYIVAFLAHQHSRRHWQSRAKPVFPPLSKAPSKITSGPGPDVCA